MLPRMIIVCPSCQARYKFDESKLGTRPRARTKCAKCGGSIDIENPLLAAMTLPPGMMPPSAPPEAEPRPHGVLEVIGDHAILRDLGSTNGTFVDLERIEQQVLNNHMEFRIGSHVLMFIVTEVE